MEEYIRGPFTLDIIYRSNPVPNDEVQQKYKAFSKKIFSTTGWLDEGVFKRIQRFMQMSAMLGQINRQEFGWARETVHAAIGTFTAELDQGLKHC